MTRFGRLSLFLLASGWSLAVGPVARAAGPPIEDAAVLFSEGVRQRATAAVQAVAERYRLDVRIETFPEIPSAKTAPYHNAKPAGRDRFFTHWAQDQAAAERIDGLFVLVCKEPLRVRVVSHGPSANRFTDRQCFELRRRLETAFEGHRFDAGLLEGLDFVRGQLEIESRGSPWPWIGAIFLGALAVWALLSLLNAKLRVRRPDAVPVVAPGDALLGGTLGAMGGYWITPSLFAGFRSARRSTEA